MGRGVGPWPGPGWVALAIDIWLTRTEQIWDMRIPRGWPDSLSADSQLPTPKIPVQSVAGVELVFEGHLGACAEGAGAHPLGTPLGYTPWAHALSTPSPSHRALRSSGPISSPRGLWTTLRTLDHTGGCPEGPDTALTWAAEGLSRNLDIALPMGREAVVRSTQHPGEDLCHGEVCKGGKRRQELGTGSWQQEGHWPPAFSLGVSPPLERMA